MAEFIGIAPTPTSGHAKVVARARYEPQCTSGAFRGLTIHQDEPARQRARELVNTPEFAKAQRQRKKVEALFAELKNQIGLRRLRLRQIEVRAGLVIAIVGTTVLVRMPVDLFPPINIPVVVVATFYSGMPPEQIETDITGRFERFFTLGSNIDHIESRSLARREPDQDLFSAGHRS